MQQTCVSPPSSATANDALGSGPVPPLAGAPWICKSEGVSDYWGAGAFKNASQILGIVSMVAFGHCTVPKGSRRP